ncbi:hypothetical protein EV421DRAFT_1743546 [Armillaria borealis]|uniref:Aminoglycoside phosphotransferase domain-containing protein n=1 Tax=Armillaria borealis TaxID=47425 RepID=A0AA39IY42_9AGAR|nr:hypothetical protein EV421DRAFT_1743546 [Armillaria borealis]
MFPQAVLLLLYRMAITVADGFATCWEPLCPIPNPKLVPRQLKGWPSEALAQELVHKRSSIPVPAIWRVVHLNDHGSVIIMDHIPGSTLAEAWPTMTLWQKIRTALSLQSYVPSAQIHPTSPSPHSWAACRRRTGWALFRLAHLRPYETHPGGPLPDDGTLVFSHVDLALRNVIMGKDGQLWLIDFATVGFYPKWFEYINMRMDAEVEFRREYDWVWNAILPFVCDPYFSTYDWIATVAPDYL